MADSEPPNFRFDYSLDGFENAVSSVKFSPSGDFVAGCSYDSDIKLWDVYDKRLVADLVGHKAGVSEIDWSTDSRLLVSASDDKNLKIWNVNRGKCVKTLKGHAHNVFCTRFSPQNDLILSGSDDLLVKLWDVGTGKCIKTIEGHTDRVTAVDFDYKASRMLTSSYDGCCYVYDMTSGECITCIKSEDNRAISFAKFSPNGEYVLYATLDNTIKLWNLKKNKRSRTYTGHRNEIFSIFAIFSEGKWIISGSEDNFIYIWPLNPPPSCNQSPAPSCDVVEVLKGHTAVVIAIDYNPKQNMIVSGALDPDNTIKFWKS